MNINNLLMIIYLHLFILLLKNLKQFIIYLKLSYLHILLLNLLNYIQKII